MRPSVDDLRKLPDWLGRYRWNLVFDKFPEGMAAPSHEALNLRCVSADVPKKTGGTFNVILRGWTLICPGIWTTSGTIVLTFIETIDNIISDFLQAWNERAWSMRTGRAWTKKELTATVRLVKLDRTDKAVREYKMDVIIADYDPGGGLDADSTDTRPTLTLAYDYFEEGPSAG